MHLFYFILNFTGFGCIWWGIIRMTLLTRVGENGTRVQAFWGMVGWSQSLVSDILQHSSFAYLSAVFLAIDAYVWWISGGGDGLKRRIKNLVQKLTPKPLVLARIN